MTGYLSAYESKRAPSIRAQVEDLYSIIFDQGKDTATGDNNRRDKSERETRYCRHYQGIMQHESYILGPIQFAICVPAGLLLKPYSFF